MTKFKPINKWHKSTKKKQDTIKNDFKFVKNKLSQKKCLNKNLVSEMLDH